MDFINQQRRTLLQVAGAGWLTAALTACSRSASSEDPRDPEPMNKPVRCTVCGMFLAPGAQVFLSGIDKALAFCSAQDAALFALQPENKRRLEVLWARRYSDPTQWINAEKSFIVVGSSHSGAMGREPAFFRTRHNAENFQKSHGGKVIRFSALTLKDLS